MTDKIKNMFEKIKPVMRNIKNKVQSRYQVIREFFKKTYNKHCIYMYVTTAILLNLVIEMLARGSFIKGIYFLIASPYVFLCNSIIILMTLSVTFLMRRRFWGLSLISFIWLLSGVTNSILLSNRVTPFTAMDLMLVDSAFGVVTKYFSIVQIVMVAVSVTLAIALLVLLFFKAPKVQHKIKYPRNIIAIVIIWIIGFGSINLGVGSELMSMKFGELRVSYYDYGFVYCFTNSLINTGIAKPNTYSGETVEKIVDKTEKKKISKAKKKPNIIFLQLESFFDMTHLNGVKFSKNPVPNFERLMKKYPSGYFNVPIVGAGTVNTEFEVMTGINLDYFGPGEYPFKTKLVDTTCESVCFNLKDYGYNCHAIHNNTATFYGRNVVFSNLGYDTFTTIENMHIEDFTPMGWAKDYYLTEYILDALKSTKNQDFVYAISVQGHGSYPTDGNYDYPIKVRGVEDEDTKHKYQYYAMQIYEMDQFIGKLTKALKQLGEETILVMYGDHLPSFGLSGEDLDNGDVYQTEYVIWSNFDNDYYTSEDLEAYQLQSKILGGLNMDAGDINKYTQQHKGEDQETYDEGLKNLSYDLLYGDKYATNGENPYKATDMKLGLNEVKLSSVTPLYDQEGTVYLYGNNFTAYSKVYINEEKQTTEYIDPNTLMIVYPELKAGDEISVYQQNSDDHVLTQTESFAFNDDELQPQTKNKKKMKRNNKK
ncbi:MAG: sulfatase-like hydrolase/transferase [Eubacterium sp.]|nr:sulfatase-like hydrolase/transferase [Eubacterium sp.]